MEKLIRIVGRSAMIPSASDTVSDRPRRRAPERGRRTPPAVALAIDFSLVIESAGNQRVGHRDLEELIGTSFAWSAPDMRRLCLALLFTATADATYTFQAGDDDVPRAWAMYFGGSGSESARAIATDAAGNSYVVGSTSSTTGFPAPGIPSPGSYLLKFDSAGALQYAVPVSGTVYDVATTPDGGAVVVASRTQFADVYVMKVTGSGSAGYQTDIPGLTMSAPYPERAAIAAGPVGHVAVAGRSAGGSFGVPPRTVGPAGGEDAVVVMLDPQGTITSVTLIGGTGADAGADVAMDASGGIYVAGRTS
jgi:hypothetical protein